MDSYTVKNLFPAIAAIKKNRWLYVAKTILTRIKGWQDGRRLSPLSEKKHALRG